MDYLPFVTALLALVLYLNTLEAGFAYDDSRAILKNPDLLPETPLWNLVYDDFWGTPLTHSGSHKSYRPLCVLTFRLNYLLGELTPWGYHLGNVIIHALTTFVFTAVARVFLKTDTGTLTAGLLFAAHPIHTEAVAGIVGRADALACLLFLLTMVSYMRYVDLRASPNGDGISRWPWAALALLLSAAAMLTKEQALTILAVCWTYDVFIAQRASLQDLFTLKIFTKRQFRGSLEGTLLIGACSSALLGFRIYFMGNKPPEFAPSDNPASDSDSFLTRALTYNYLPSLNFWMLLCPTVLSFDWSMDSIPLVEAWTDPRNLSTLAFYVTLAYILFCVAQHINEDNSAVKNCDTSLNGFRSSPCRTLNNNSVKSSLHYSEGEESPYIKCISIRPVDSTILALSILIFPFIPASNLFFYVGFVIAERILYIPSMGACLLVGLGFDALYAKFFHSARRKFLVAGLALLVLSFSAKTVLRNRDWQTEERLYSAGVAVNPAKAWGNLANVFNDKQQYGQAEEAYRNALKYRSNMADVHYNLGILLQNQNRLSEAIDSYKKAIQFRPRLTVAHLNLGIMTAQMGDTELAKKIYSHCADLDTSGLKDPRLHDGTKISCMFNHGRILMDEDKLKEALAMFMKALQRRPDHYGPQSIYNMIGEVYYKMGQLEEAEKWYREALKSKPDHLPAFLTMSKLMQMKTKWEESESWLKKAKQFHPTDLTVDFHLAQLYASMQRFSDSIQILEKLLPVMSNDFDIVYNAANVYREADLKDKAEELYMAAVKLKPNEAAAWMNLGAMFHINTKYKQAEQAYLKALELKPNDKVTTENLQRLHNLVGKVR
ncbi:protein O-mannosyl-transferase TMTC2-like [Biomphalaria glabrata]|uniref:dolichyl-phosphate-mannose--protein mannosyltransferase n=1 Tax=Biomphalaria glabrata TaxID=6526 RepID=A0A9W3API5_BIOGL|nr:protein O-mannosyl-transferase TMTC2-like [Biomphalaria glabrata]